MWFLYALSIFLITFSDGQGLFLVFAVLVFLAICSLFVQRKNIYSMLLIGVASILVHELYRFIIAPDLTFILNEYWPDFSYVQTIPIHNFFQNPSAYLIAGSLLYGETLRFLIGNPPLMVAYLFIILCIIMPVIYLCMHPNLSSGYKKYFFVTWFGLIIINFLVVVMNVLMILRHESLMMPDIMRTYYGLPANIIIAMTLAMLTDIFFKLRIPRWLVLMLMCVAIAGNIAALPKHRSMMKEGHIKRSYEFSSSVLNALKQFGAPDNFNALSVNNSNLLAFFKSQKNKLSIDVQDYNKKGIDYAQRGQYRLAIKHFNHAIRRNPHDLPSYVYRGDLYLKLQHQQQAIEDCNAVLRLKPDFTLAYNNRGSAYINQGNNYLGCRDFQKACDLGDCLLLKIAKNEGVCP